MEQYRHGDALGALAGHTRCCSEEQGAEERKPGIRASGEGLRQRDRGVPQDGAAERVESGGDDDRTGEEPGTAALLHGEARHEAAMHETPEDHLGSER